MCRQGTNVEDQPTHPVGFNTELFETLYRLRETLNAPPIGNLLDEIERSKGPPGEKLLDERDAAALLGISAKSLGNRRRRGELPAATHVQQGKRRRVHYVRDALLLYFKINPHN